MAARLKEKYAKEVAPALRKEFEIDNVMAVPRLEKIVLNMGLGEAVANPKMLEGAVGRAVDDRGAARRRDEGEEVDRHLQAADGHAHRRAGDACAATGCGSSSTA